MWTGIPKCFARLCGSWRGSVHLCRAAKVAAVTSCTSLGAPDHVTLSEASWNELTHSKDP